MAEQPGAPDLERRDYVLGVLSELVARSGAASLLAPPVDPGPEAFPEVWQPTVRGATRLLRRLAGYAGQDRAIIVVDERRGALATERKPETQLELTRIENHELVFTLSYLGEDDIVGTFAHEIGLAHAVHARVDTHDPYRVAEQSVLTVDPERDLDRGSIATVYLGLGVLAANASYQQYSRSGPFLGGGYAPLEYDVVRAGYVPMSELAYLLAVQAAVRGETTPPHGLLAAQRDEVVAWLDVLKDQQAELRARLGIPADAEGIAARPAPELLDAEEVAEAAPAARRAFRWLGHRGFYGFAVGLLCALGLGVVAFRNAPDRTPMLAGLAIGAVVGHAVGRGIRIARCSACATVVEVRASQCRRCGAAFHGDITALSQRLEAEERLDASDRRDRDAS